MRRGSELGDVGMIADGSVLLRDGRIISVGTTRRLENMKESRTALEVPVHGRVVLPGFIDAGLQLSLDRSREGRKPLRASEFFDDSLGLMRACLQHGTVTAKLHASADCGSFESDIPVLRKLAQIGDHPVRMVKTWRLEKGAAAETSWAAVGLETTSQILLKRKFVDAISVLAGTGGEPDTRALAILQAAGLRLDLLWPGGSLQLLQSAFERLRPGAVYLKTPVTPAEADFLAQQDTIAVLTAGKTTLEGKGDPLAARSLIDGGGAIALSSGYHSGNAPNFNMQMAIALAVVRLGLTPEEAITAATINAAYAIGCDATTGSLEVGKQADIVVLNVPDLRELPQQFGVNHVAMVFRSGSMVLNRTRWRAPNNEAGANRMRSKPV